VWGGGVVWFWLSVCVSLSLPVHKSRSHGRGVFPAVTRKPEGLPANRIREGETFKAGSRLDAGVKRLVRSGVRGRERDRS
jgi:hypothetical protein